MTVNMKNFLINSNRTVKQAMRQLSDIGERQLFVVDDGDILQGALSDGDIRKWILGNGALDGMVEVVANKSPKSVGRDFTIGQVRSLMLDCRIEAVPVLDEHGRVEDVLIWDKVFSGEVPRHRGIIDVPVAIMAGGKGARLDPFTRILPKPLIPIGEKPIIEIIMDKFLEYQVPLFYISIFHKARMIRSYFEEVGGEYKIEFVEEQKPLGTSGALGLLRKKIDKEVLVTNCDVIVDTDYVELLQFHRSNKYDLTLVLSMRHYKIPYGVCELASGGVLTAIKEKPEYDLLVNTGMYIVGPRVLDIIPESRPYTVIDLVKDAKANGLSVGAFPISEKSWIDVGQWDEYAKSVQDIEKRLMPHDQTQHILKNI